MKGTDKTIPPDDCAIEVTYDPNRKPPFQLERTASSGSNYSLVSFDPEDGFLGLTLPPGQKEKRFSISFRLSERDLSSGFAGIKVWRDGDKEPAGFFLPPRGRTHSIPSALPAALPFDLHAYFTAQDHEDPNKAFLLSIGDKFSKTGKYNYCLGIYHGTREPQNIVADDPRIYNNGEPGDGGKRPGRGSWWRGLFGSGR